MKCLALKFSRVLIICLIQIAITASIINAKPGVYIFGVVPQYNAQVIHEIWQPILGILSKKTYYPNKSLCPMYVSLTE